MITAATQRLRAPGGAYLNRDDHERPIAMNRRLAPIPAIIAAVALLAPVASADVVTLSDGSTLLGNVVELIDGKLILETQFAGTLEIDGSMISSIQTDQPVNVGMDSGDRLVGEIEWKPGLNRAVVQTEMGGVPVDVTRVTAIWPKDGKSPEVRAMEIQIAETKAEMERNQPKWTAILEAGLIYKEGNSDVLEGRARAELKRKSPVDLLRFYLSGEYAEENDERSAAEVKGGFYYEHDLFDNVFAYGRIDLEYDEFENLDLRVSTALGMGYYWIREEAHELKTRAGIGYLHEAYMDDRTEDTAEAEVALNYRVDLAPWLRFTEDAAWYPTFDSIDNYRLVSDSAFVIPLGDSDVWKLKLGALYEYKAQPAAGRERLDQTYYANILAELK
jgi:putative salt-induced outer membrane protein YdiY